MPQKRSTPLNKRSIEKDQCTIDVRLAKLRMVPFFSCLEMNDLERVNEKFDVTPFTAGDTIYRQGESAALLRVVVSGSIKLIRRTSDGKEILLDMLKPGEHFGSLSQLGDNRYNETATAQSDSCVMAIGSREFRSLLMQFPEVAVSVLSIVTDKLNHAREKIRHLTTLSVEKRIVHILLTLCDKFGEESRHGMLLQVPLSRKDLADMAGTSTETASRIMSKLQQDEIIESGRQWVAIKDREKLSDLLPDH